MKIRNIFCIFAILIVGFYFGQKYTGSGDVSIAEAANDENIKAGPWNSRFGIFYFKDKENDKEYIVICSNFDGGITVTPRLK